MRLLSTITASTLVILLWPSAAGANQCAPVRTNIVTTYSMGPDCASPVGVCTTGSIASGKLAGTTHYTALTITPGPSPDLLFYTGELVVTTSAGTLTLRDFGLLNPVTARFYEVQQIVSGTGAYAGLRGTLTSQGVSTPTGFQGTLSGPVCNFVERAERITPWRGFSVP